MTGTFLCFVRPPPSRAVLPPTSRQNTTVISGVFESFSRDELKSLIEKHGGKFTGSISKKTDFIVAGENMGPSKYEKAEKLGIPIVDEKVFLAMLP